MESNGKQWKAMESNGKQWKAMESNGKQWKAMENNVNKIYLSMESFRKLSNAWMEIDYPLECDDIEWVEIRNIITEYGCFIRKLICEYFSKLEFDEEDLKGLQKCAVIFNRLQRDRKTLHRKIELLKKKNIMFNYEELNSFLNECINFEKDVNSFFRLYI